MNGRASVVPNGSRRATACAYVARSCATDCEAWGSPGEGEPEQCLRLYAERIQAQAAARKAAALEIGLTVEGVTRDHLGAYRPGRRSVLADVLEILELRPPRSAPDQYAEVAERQLLAAALHLPVLHPAWDGQGGAHEVPPADLTPDEFTTPARSALWRGALDHPGDARAAVVAALAAVDDPEDLLAEASVTDRGMAQTAEPPHLAYLVRLASRRREARRAQLLERAATWAGGAGAEPPPGGGVTPPPRSPQAATIPTTTGGPEAVTAGPRTSARRS